jgi:hypothetical protein
MEGMEGKNKKGGFKSQKNNSILYADDQILLATSEDEL